MFKNTCLEKKKKKKKHLPAPHSPGCSSLLAKKWGVVEGTRLHCLSSRRESVDQSSSPDGYSPCTEAVPWLERRDVLKQQDESFRAVHPWAPWCSSWSQQRQRGPAGTGVLPAGHRQHSLSPLPSGTQHSRGGQTHEGYGQSWHMLF